MHPGEFPAGRLSKAFHVVLLLGEHGGVVGSESTPERPQAVEPVSALKCVLLLSVSRIMVIY